MPRVHEYAPGILPSRSISLGSRISTITTSPLTPSRYAAMASAALRVSISALASSIIALMPRVMVWGIDGPFDSRHSGARLLARARNDDRLPHQFPHRAFQSLDGDRIHALRK